MKHSGIALQEKASEMKATDFDLFNFNFDSLNFNFDIFLNLREEVCFSWEKVESYEHCSFTSKTAMQFTPVRLRMGPFWSLNDEFVPFHAVFNP